ncbi:MULTISPECIES: N-acetylmuramoyl-L-alanine amidase [Bacillaceae]|uniref:N-acetylmuramoyl-L-alanine amidase n=1 Tax=Domibacillus aminovorans TaxID=29332 RepID=A0A177KN26_9BACI|nr:MULTISPECIES: N-acetylmuramoyl-L-alanine amidase [Bacillaceae]OAH54544.1 N-acetylmuramoyl-L-alanine amidase [Domibacillus aminovorans]
MNKQWGAWILVLIALIVSAGLLFIDSQSSQGLLNSFDTGKPETIKPPAAIVKEESVPKPELEPIEPAALEKETVVTQAVDIPEPEPVPVPAADPFLVVIDPGHQAKANLDQEPIGPGAAETKYKVTGGTTGIVTKKPEYVLNLEAAQLLKSALEARDMKVILTRTTNDVDMSNSERAAVANDNEADLFVRLHADGSENPATSGFSVLIPAKENPYTSAIFADSELAANHVIQAVSADIPLHQTGIFYRDDMSGFNWSKVPVILPEIGFMTNAEEDQNLSDPAYLTNVMNLLADGIVQYANNN